MMEEKTHIGYRIQTLRKEKRISQENLAAHLDVDRGAILRIENGSISPRWDQILQIAEYFDLPWQTIVDDDRSKKAPKPVEKKPGIELFIKVNTEDPNVVKLVKDLLKI